MIEDPITTKEESEVKVEEATPRQKGSGRRKATSRRKERRS